MTKPYRKSTPPKPLTKPAPKANKDTNPEVLAALQKALRRKQY